MLTSYAAALRCHEYYIAAIIIRGHVTSSLLCCCCSSLAEHTPNSIAVAIFGHYTFTASYYLRHCCHCRIRHITCHAIIIYRRHCFTAIYIMKRLLYCVVVTVTITPFFGLSFFTLHLRRYCRFIVCYHSIYYWMSIPFTAALIARDRDIWRHRRATLATWYMKRKAYCHWAKKAAIIFLFATTIIPYCQERECLQAYFCRLLRHCLLLAFIVATALYMASAITIICHYCRYINILFAITPRHYQVTPSHYRLHCHHIIHAHGWLLPRHGCRRLALLPGFRHIITSAWMSPLPYRHHYH